MYSTMEIESAMNITPVTDTFCLMPHILSNYITQLRGYACKCKCKWCRIIYQKQTPLKEKSTVIRKTLNCQPQKKRDNQLNFFASSQDISGKRAPETICQIESNFLTETHKILIYEPRSYETADHLPPL